MNCNLRCKHCYNLDKLNDSSVHSVDIKKFLDIAKNLSAELVTIQGGDPLLRNDIEDIFKILFNYGINFDIKGNPEKINQSIINLLKKYNIDRYQLSLDGLKNVHDILRKKDSFDKTINAIKLLNKNNIHVNIKFTLSEKNIDQIWKLIYYLYNKNLKINSFSISRIYSEHSFINTDNIFKRKFLQKFLDEYLNFYNYQIENKRILLHINFKEHLWYAYLLEKGIILDDVNFELNNHTNSNICSCLSGFSTFVNSDQNYDLCPKLKTNISSSSIIEFNNKRCIFIKNLLENNCFHCKYKNTCRGCPAFYFKHKDVSCELFKEDDKI